ncbi:hypothetical protein L1887_05312 [Cichorium endivia]|nr:hypothetical protein L1887_05312 [Cichorium endivia]
MRTLNPKVSLLNPKSIIISKASDIRAAECNGWKSGSVDESESFALSVGELQRVECLRSLSEIAIALAERPSSWKTNRGSGINNQVSKVNMAILGITETIHHTCYAWVIFCQILQDVESMSNVTEAVAVSASLVHALWKQIETISGTLVLSWVNAQLSRILGWVERAVQQERWEPVQQRHGSSVIEVHRIVEEMTAYEKKALIEVGKISMQQLTGSLSSPDGLFRVLLDGGPLRLLMPSDAKFFEEDL